ncbi:conserved protein of unknown function (plasmid) [Rhodovastum atsumiense]|uniref:Uncharacterized protein n=1 Tax=Rhodovastum atsumiense TaxID=504468 RepID=A0A5M6IU44_9PROT|nr:hypothetical protein [Rhodovastum atsumiense]KAA5611843.1 hypothetical protein F1189_12465 [Rhodovastum atsumiense]CAH2606186.1 conserved protein of unknown function [Rhodovastum atsumiense]
MIGGKVIEVRREGEVARVWCVDGWDELAIHVVAEADLPAPSDTVWWQGRAAYWTDAARTFADRRLDRRGYSFDPRNALGAHDARTNGGSS